MHDPNKKLVWIDDVKISDDKSLKDTGTSAWRIFIGTPLKLSDTDLISELVLFLKKIRKRAIAAKSALKPIPQ